MTSEWWQWNVLALERGNREQNAHSVRLKPYAIIGVPKRNTLTWNHLGRHWSNTHRDQYSVNVGMNVVMGNGIRLTYMVDRGVNDVSRRIDEHSLSEIQKKKKMKISK